MMAAVAPDPPLSCICVESAVLSLLIYTNRQHRHSQRVLSRADETQRFLRRTNETQRAVSPNIYISQLCKQSAENRILCIDKHTYIWYNTYGNIPMIVLPYVHESPRCL